MIEIQDHQSKKSTPKTLSALLTNPSLWALLDQGVVSGGSFLTNITIARLSSVNTYGRFTLYLSAIIFLNSLHSALVIYPLSVTIAGEDSPKRQKSILACALLFTAAAVATLSLFAIPLSHRQGLVSIGLAILALLAWQTQETCRRALMATLNISGAILGDFVSYPGQALLIYGLYRYQHQLSLEMILICMAATSLTAAAIQLFQLRASPLLSNVGFEARNFWSLGRWGVGGALLSVTSTQAFVAVLGLRFGPPAAASLQALINVVGLTHPVILGISNAVVPHVAKTNSTGTPRQAAAVGLRMGLHGALFAFPCLLLIIAAPSFVLKFFYGAHSPYVLLTTPLIIICCSYLLLYTATLFGSILNGLNHPRLSFKAYSISSALSIVIGLPLAALFGVVGATVGMVIAFGSRVISQALSSRKVLHVPNTENALG